MRNTIPSNIGPTNSINPSTAVSIPLKFLRISAVFSQNTKNLHNLKHTSHRFSVIAVRWDVFLVSLSHNPLHLNQSFNPVIQQKSIPILFSALNWLWCCGIIVVETASGFVSLCNIPYILQESLWKLKYCILATYMLKYSSSYKYC